MRSLLLLSLLMISSCVCNDDLIKATTLNDLEIDLVNLNSQTEFIYEDEQGRLLNAVANYADINVERDRRGPESCEYFQFETKETVIFTTGFLLNSIYLTIRSSSSSLRTFSAYILETDVEGNVMRSRLNSVVLDQDGLSSSNLSTVTIRGFTFNNAIELTTDFEGSNIINMIITPLRGIEYIGYANDKYLKLVP
jgi:hypothetical protein